MTITEHNKSKFSEQRRLLIDSLRRKGNLSDKVLDIMSNLPRELFINPALSSRAYEDNALPIAANQTISQPYTVAFMTSLLEVRKDDKILEIGTGSGYQACILNMLGARVFTVERIPELYEASLQIFKSLNMNINSRLADGTLGWREFAPFDGIMVTAAAPKVPKQMAEQLSVGGRMVVPVGDKISQEMVLVIKISDIEFEEKRIDRFKFVPLIGKEGWRSDSSF